MKIFFFRLFIFLSAITLLGGAINYVESSKFDNILFKWNSLINNKYGIGTSYLHGKGVEQDKVKGLTIIFNAANNGDESSTEFYANILWNNYSKKGVTELSSKELFTWTKKASLISNNNIYPHHLGHLYEHGIGVEKNHNSAIQEYKKAMTRCNDTAKYALSALLRNGNESSRNYKESFKYKLELAHKGHSFSQYQTALNYNAGVGVIQNYIEAYAWLLIYKANTDDTFGFDRSLQEELNLKVEKGDVVEAQERAKALKVLGVFKNISLLCKHSNLID